MSEEIKEMDREFEMDKLRRQLNIMTGKYEVARGIADKLIKSEIIGCNMGHDICNDCSNNSHCQFMRVKSELAELDK